MAKVKLLYKVNGQPVDSTLEVTEKEADRLVSLGYARKLEEPKSAKATPKRTSKAKQEKPTEKPDQEENE